MTNKEEIFQYLNQSFSQFEPGLKDTLVDSCTIRRFTTGEVLMEPGQYFRATMLIVEGRVKLYRKGEDGEEFFMYYIEPGGACALSMICAAKQETSEVRAKSVEETVALNVPIHLMDNLMKEYKSWYYFVLDTYRSRYEELLAVIDNIAFKNMDERLRSYLKKQSEKLKTRQLQITHQEIANDLGSSREVISRLLKKMEQRGDLALNRSFIEWKS
ncbi:Crp/Fnr family transcriptional regulator [Desertivirga brevis]|uniref:Crp/Fnr family transcriptional regulator n=1 Tax=Desertivirga brevis TaxID=2810310 RepID=UPI001A9674EA|nr:Crp/Fnr family transcriptional regulator [Pedobacter sp. SYSU D00873]